MMKVPYHINSVPNKFGYQICLVSNKFGSVPELLNDQDFRLIQHRKVVYIPKIPKPVSPGDYRPLSMLEVLYKIPFQILSARLSRVLPTTIGPHQHGFMAQRGIQEPSLLATPLI
jgi:hypothetical protein